VTKPDEGGKLRELSLVDAEEAVNKLDRRIRENWNTTRNRRVRGACEDANLVAEFVAGYLVVEEENDFVGVELRHKDYFVEVFEVIHETVGKFDGCLSAIEQGAPEHEQELLDTLADLATTLRQWLGEAVDAFVAVIKDLTARGKVFPRDRAEALRLAGEIRGKLETRQLIHEASRALNETLRVRDEVKVAAGTVGAGHAGAFYEEHANLEYRTANRLRAVVACLLTATTVGVLVFVSRLEPLTLGSELVRLSATIPIALLAGYLELGEGTGDRPADLARLLRTSRQRRHRTASRTGHPGAGRGVRPVAARRQRSLRRFRARGDSPGQGRGNRAERSRPHRKADETMRSRSVPRSAATPTLRAARRPVTVRTMPR
jgi:hypothetical protein